MADSAPRRPTTLRSAADGRDPTLPPITGPVPIARLARTATAPRPTARNRAVGTGTRPSMPASPAAGGLVAGRSERPPAPRALRWLGRLVLLAAVAGGLYALGYGGWRFVTTSPRFDVDDVRVEGMNDLRHVDPTELTRRLGIVGRNVFTLDADAIARDVESDPWIRRSEVTRVLPSTVVVRVREERAVVLVTMDGLYLADCEGRLFKRLGPTDEADFPVVSGVPRALYEEEPERAVALVRGGIALARAWADSPAAARARLEEVVVDPAAGATLHVTLGDAARPAAVRLGRGGAEAERLARFVRVLDALAARGAEPSLILLDDALRPDRVMVHLKGGAVEDS